MRPKKIIDQFTIKELSHIFQISNKSTIRHLRHFNVPIETRQRFKSYIPADFIKSNNIDLYQSIELTLLSKVDKPFFTIKDLANIFNKTHSGMYRWIKRNKIPVYLCGNKTVLLASVLLKLPTNSGPF